MIQRIAKLFAEATPGPLDVVFTQYLRPHGRPTRVWIERDVEIVRKAKAIEAAGCRLEIEELMTRDVSMTIERTVDGEDEIVSCRLCHNGPDVPRNVDEMIAEAYERLERAK